MDTPFDIAQSRLKDVEQMDRILARQREQLAELEQLREQQKALLLNGTSDLFEAILQYESGLIKYALRASDKSVTKAARLLNVSYQWLIFAIDSRHPELMDERSPIYRRRTA